MKPILFNTEMVRAILDGRKTVTRRTIKHYGKSPLKYGRDKFYKIVEELNGNPFYGAGFYKDSDIFVIDGVQHIDAIYFKAPYQVGDILYVRETWQCINPYSDKEYVYKASCDKDYASDIGKWCPSIHMPKEAARIFLRVTDVRVERLQEITAEDMQSEQGISEENSPCNTCNSIDGYGFGCMPAHGCKLEDSFIDLWNSTIKKQDLDQFCWNANPWVWVIEFERCNREKLH